MQNIICAIDFSDSSISALKYACEISKKMNTTLVVTHVYKNASLGSHLKIPNFLLDNVFQEKQMQKLQLFCLKNIGNYCNKKTLIYKAIEHNSVTTAINILSSKINAKFVVVGKRGLHKLKDFLIGNTTKNLIEKSICPVLAIPNGYNEKKIKVIIYATDFEKEDVFAIKDLVEIAKIFKPAIKIIHISKIKENDSLEQMEWFKELVFQETNYKNLEFKVLFSQDILNTIHNYLEDNNADMLALLKRKKPSFFNNIIYGDLVKTFEFFCNIPIICFNTNNY